MSGSSADLPALLDRLRADNAALPGYLADLTYRFRAREPALHAFVPEEGRFSRLQRDVRAVLTQFPTPGSRPRLFGLPIGVKDIFHVDGFTTRAGSRLSPALLQGPEAASVSRLRAAGALVLGKTITTEFAYFGPGPTRNPHDPTRTPGGSSSGSAAAVGAGICPLALGTQTIGSINRPAAYCGVVGYKPSYDRISRDGVIPLAPSLDHVGLFSRQVAGAALVAAILCRDWQSPSPPPERLTLGVPEGPYLEETEPAALAYFRATCDRLAAAGWEVRPVPALPDFAEVRRHHLALMAAEAAQVHQAWFARYADLYHEKTAALIRDGQATTEAEVAEARRQQRHLRRRLQELMAEHGLDAWITPSATGPAPRGLESTGNPVMNLPWTNAGLPTLTVPSGRDEGGLPLAVQLVGNWWADEALFALGERLEAAL